MKVYLDTGVFIDYLSPQAIAGTMLRSGNRRRRSPQQLFEDADRVLRKIARDHTGATLCFTFYEIEEALFKQLTSLATGIANASTIRVATARSIVPQTRIAIIFFQITVLDLTTQEVMEAQLSNTDLLFRGIRAADALHVASAINFDAEILISTDENLLKLDNVIKNKNGVAIKICDTDEAFSFL